MLPVAREAARLAGSQRQRCDTAQLLAIGLAAAILAPCHFGGVVGEIGTGDVVVRLDLGAAKARDEAFRRERRL